MGTMVTLVRMQKNTARRGVGASECERGVAALPSLLPPLAWHHPTLQPAGCQQRQGPGHQHDLIPNYGYERLQQVQRAAGPHEGRARRGTAPNKLTVCAAGRSRGKARAWRGCWQHGAARRTSFAVMLVEMRRTSMRMVGVVCTQHTYRWSTTLRAKRAGGTA